jgi:hypothetical protein
MKPKPEPAVHRPELVRVLSAALRRVDPLAAEWLVADEDRFDLVSWTSLLYPERQDIATDLPGIDALLKNPLPSARDKREARAIWRSLYRAWHLIGDSYPLLSRLVASQALNVTLGDVRCYLENRDGVAVEIRQLLIDRLLSAWDAGDRVLLIGHSLGSVIAYDSLWQLSRESQNPGRVGLFMSLGSPLATRFIRKCLLGSHLSGPERFPGNIDRWVNVSARGEMVALHRRVKPFFADMLKFGLVQSIDDVPGIYNHFRRDGDGTLNVHKSYGYLNHRLVAELICRWLAV